MKKKIRIAALASVLSVALIGGTLVVPVFAADDNSKEDIEISFAFEYCPYCEEVFVDETMEKLIKQLDEHKKVCPQKPVESTEQENNDTNTVEIKDGIVPLADDNSKEDIEIDVNIPEEKEKCPYCEEEFDSSKLEEHEKVCPQNPDNQKPVEPEKPTVTITKEPNDNAKEQIEISVGGLFDLNCPICGEIAVGYHQCKPTYECDSCGKSFYTEKQMKEHKKRHGEVELVIPLTNETETNTNTESPNSKEEIELEIELPENDNTEKIAALEAEVIEAERIASEARAEADRLENIAVEKRAALEAARQ